MWDVGYWRKEHGGAFGTFFDFWGVLNWEGFAHVIRGMSDVRGGWDGDEDEDETRENAEWGDGRVVSVKKKC